MIGIDDVAALAAWVAKTVMIAEFFKPETRAIPQANRTWLMENLIPPQVGWNIWMAPYAGPLWVTGIFHHSMELPVPGPDGSHPDPSGQRNTQLTTIKLGYIALVAITTTATSKPITIGDEQTSDFKRSGRRVASP